MSDHRDLSKPWRAPEGWERQAGADTFSSHAGPFYFRRDGKAPGVGFFAEPYHANLGGIVHGGALMTLADMALFNICIFYHDGVKALTMTMNTEFLRPAPIGAFITATGEVMKAGKSAFFVRGHAEVNGRSVLSFSGTLKRID